MGKPKKHAVYMDRLQVHIYIYTQSHTSALHSVWIGYNQSISFDDSLIRKAVLLQVQQNAEIYGIYKYIYAYRQPRSGKQMQIQESYIHMYILII